MESEDISVKKKRPKTAKKEFYKASVFKQVHVNTCSIPRIFNLCS